jgi:hypothetical protein
MTVYLVLDQGTPLQGQSDFRTTEKLQRRVLSYD